MEIRIQKTYFIDMSVARILARMSKLDLRLFPRETHGKREISLIVCIVRFVLFYIVFN